MTYHIKKLKPKCMLNVRNKTIIIMSTSGYFIFKYNGKYYVFRNRHDAYVWGQYGLGSRLVENLKKLSKEELIQLLEHMLLILEVDIEDEDEEEKDRDVEPDFISIEHALSNPRSYEYWIKKHEPAFYKNGKLNIFYCGSADYLYIINLDQDLFVINSSDVVVQFSLFDIPNDWYEFYERVLESNQDEDDEEDPDCKAFW